MPNEDVIKFKKAHNTLTSVVRELVTSDNARIMQMQTSQMQTLVVETS